MSDWFDDASEIATWAARVTHRKYHTYFDASDVKNELIVWILKHEKKIRSWLDTDDMDQRKQGSRQLGKTLKRLADKYCRRLKAQMVGYHLEDEAFYPPVSLPRLLPFVWGDVEQMQQVEGQKVSGGSSPAEGGNMIVQLFDIRMALDKLDPQDRLLLQMKYFEELTFAEIATVLGVSQTTAHRKHDGALRRITESLGGESPFTRKEIEEHEMD